MALQGGAIAVVVNWNCNFDNSAKECNPQFEFIRVFVLKRGGNKNRLMIQIRHCLLVSILDMPIHIELAKMQKSLEICIKYMEYGSCF